MGFFTPRFLKDARLLSEGASKTLHHHRDLLKKEQILSLEGLIGVERPPEQCEPQRGHDDEEEASDPLVLHPMNSRGNDSIHAWGAC